MTLRRDRPCAQPPRFRPVLEVLEAREVPSSLPAGFTEIRVASGLESPTAMTLAPDGRIFVAEQGGQLRVIDPSGTLLQTPFVSLNVDSTGERGLLGVAFDPQFATNQFVYVYYTVPGSPAHNRVSRFTASGNVAVPGSESVILDLDPLSAATNHNGGAIHFGPDGKLYIGVGENANSSNSQSLDNRLGKVLRINADGSIPTDNPFFNSATGANRAIWALGLRNPFTFAFQPGTNRIFINDVGAANWEEINKGVAGANYGWPLTEGEADDPRFVNPLFTYPHSGSVDQSGCAIVGAAFYNPTTGQFPANYLGTYFFADLCNNWIHRYDSATDTVTTFATDIVSTPVDLLVGPEGSLYYLSRGDGGVVSKIEFTAAPDGPGKVLTDNERYVSSLYRDILLRPADSDGLALYAGRLDQGGARSDVAHDILNSQEYHRLIVRQLYWRFLGRDPDAEGLNTYTGVLAGGGTPAEVRAFLVGSEEYFQVRGGGTIPDFLDALYADAFGRAIDPSGQATYSSVLTSAGMSRQEVALSIFTSDEFRNDLLQDDYRIYLNRPIDPSGLATYLDELRRGSPEWEIIQALVTSNEYVSRLT